MSEIKRIQTDSTVISIFDNLNDAGYNAGDKLGQGYSRIVVVRTKKFLVEAKGQPVSIDFDPDHEYIVVAIK